MTRLTLLACLASVVAMADQVTLKNGDRISGAIIKYDGKTLTIKNEFAGPVTVPWDAVVTVTSDTSLHVGLGDGQTIVGTVSTQDGKFQVQTKETGHVSAAREAVKSIRSKDEQAAYDAEIERFRNPRLTDLWAGFLDFGYATAKGNANTNTVTTAANANRATSRDKIGVTFTSLYSNSDASGKKIDTANAIRGGVSYQLNVSPKLFTFASVDLEFDQFQSLDLRFAPAGGFGYKALKTERTQFDLLGGGSLNREFFSTGLRRTSGEILLGEELVHKFNDRTSLREKLVFFPNITDTGSYRVNFDTSMVTVLRKWLSWQFSVSDRFLSNPVAGRKKNDVLLTTGIRLTFAK